MRTAALAVISLVLISGVLGLSGMIPFQVVRILMFFSLAWLVILFSLNRINRQPHV